MYRFMKGDFKMYKKGEYSKSKGFVIAISCLSIIVIALGVCVVFLLLNGNGAVPGGGDGANGGKDDASMLTIQTPYCKIEYPSEFNEHLEVKEFSENGIFTKQFLCTLSSGEYKLFSVHFGEGAGGDFFGYLLNGTERVSVYIECYSSPEASALSEEEMRLYYYMMDSVNEVARSISETSGYASH